MRAFSPLGSMLFLLSVFAVRFTLAAICNNSPQLCSRSYGNITHLGAHDSPFVSDASNNYSLSGNQFYNSTVQLDAGVRLLTTQVHSASTGPLRLCHSDCALYDAGTLVDWLKGVNNWLDMNVNDVVTILVVNSAGADSATLGQQFSASGIAKYAYTPNFSSPPSPSSWPTLAEMISAKTRLVVFVDNLPRADSATAYLMPELTYMFANAYEVLSPSNFSCLPARPTSLTWPASRSSLSNYLFLQNHFLDAPLGDTGIVIPNMGASNSTNSPNADVVGSLASSANECTALYGRAPNFLLVDWFDRGPAMETVDRLNGVVRDVSGRKVPAARAAIVPR